MFTWIKNQFVMLKVTRRFPIRWLTYRKRIWRDVDQLLDSSDGKVVFDYDYVQRTTDAVKELEGWQIKVMSLSLAVIAFQVVSYVTADASVSLFGVSVKQGGSVREILVALVSTLAVLMTICTHSKEILIAVLERITELSTDKASLQFARLATRSSFQIKVYVPQQFNDWIFPTLFTRFLSLTLWVLWSAAFFFLMLASTALQVFLAYEIYRHPTLGIWSTAIVYYVMGAFILVFFAAIKLHCPLPYRDKSDLKLMGELQFKDPRRHRELQKKYFDT